MRRLFAFIALTGAVSSLNACSGEELSATPLAGNPIPLEELSSRFAGAYCKAYLDCVGPELAALNREADCASTLRNQLDNTLFARITQLSSKGELTYDQALAGACIDEIEKSGCDAFTFRDSPACNSALEGKVGEGANCEVSPECTGALVCRRTETNGTCKSVCADRGIAGDTCYVDDDCENGLVCFATTSKCVAPRKAGEACQGPTEPDCKTGLICLGSDEKKAGKCVTSEEAFKKPVGEKCTFEDALCAGGASCAATSATGGECVAAVSSGAKCWPVAFPGQCPTGEFCKPVAALTGDNAIDFPNLLKQGTCTALPTAGQPCTPPISLSPRCTADAVCSDKKCVPVRANGETCAANEECWSGVCSNGGCTLPAQCGG